MRFSVLGYLLATVFTLATPLAAQIVPRRTNPPWPERWEPPVWPAP